MLLDEIAERTTCMDARAKDKVQFTDREVASVIESLKQAHMGGNGKGDLSVDALASFLREAAHLSYKDWSVTEVNAERLATLLNLTSIPTEDTSSSLGLLLRIVEEGRWVAAVKHASSSAAKPFAVLVTGVNGIRKTTCLYQPWFSSLLAEAFPDIPQDELPTGDNSFFRQLDHMIATLCNQEFTTLYRIAEELQECGSSGATTVQTYTNIKAAIFTRFRTLSELLGVVLIRRAQEQGSNCLMETSGRDVAMFHYIDRFFDSSKYRKLALHFEINDLAQAQASVDRRMQQEIQTGIAALSSGNVFDIVRANAGGPYGSQVLPGVQEASDRVWKEVCANSSSGSVGADWLKATIRITAHSTSAWTAQAVRPDGTTLGKQYIFRHQS